MHKVYSIEWFQNSWQYSSCDINDNSVTAWGPILHHMVLKIYFWRELTKIFLTLNSAFQITHDLCRLSISFILKHLAEGGYIYSVNFKKNLIVTTCLDMFFFLVHWPKFCGMELFKNMLKLRFLFLKANRRLSFTWNSIYKTPIFICVYYV